MTTVHSIYPVDLSEPHNGWVQDPGNSSFEPLEVEEEGQAPAVQSETRRTAFQNIILRISKKNIKT